MYKCRPSTLLDIGDPYTAYCFDEACAIIIGKIESGEEPVFPSDRNEIKRKKYTSFKDMYAKYG